MYLFFDTETTGLPKNWKAPMTDLDNWPRVIQLAWAMYDESGQKLGSTVDLIKPDGWVMPTGDFWIENGFSQEQNELEGIPIQEAVEKFIHQINESNYLVAHNMSYDQNVIGAEMLRLKLRAQKRPIKICTKDESTDYCKLPGPYGYKWPKLEELHTHLFGESFEGAHDALVDVEACARCFFELVNRQVIKL
ncbi:3'-5' exonuclease [Algivirga pacifica]|uniref:Exonuclease domain-containing protein n=1 Tax=Algivirga pacifica TaxID=1162670 RepID=A0ABP9D5D3_9BACT